MINNMDYIFDAERAIPDLGGARHGTRLILFRWNGGGNQLWRIVPRPQHGDNSEPEHAHARRVRILCQSGSGLSLTVRDEVVVLAPTDHEDERQVCPSAHATAPPAHSAVAAPRLVLFTVVAHTHTSMLLFSCVYVQCWIQSFHNTGHVTDEEGNRAFVLVNWATGKALRHSHCDDDKLVGVFPINSFHFSGS